jgi:hypothetical protein
MYARRRAGVIVAVLSVITRLVEELRYAMKTRFLIYGVLGWCLEVLWTGLPKRWPIDWRLPAHTSWWMFPIYGLIAPLYEPIHNRLRSANRPWWQRGVIYSAGILGVEAVTGALLQWRIGAIPWDYSGKTRWQWRGLTRFDYAPLWFGVGLALEPIHDWLVAWGPLLRTTPRDPS